MKLISRKEVAVGPLKQVRECSGGPAKGCCGPFVTILPGSILICLEKSDIWMFIGSLHLQFLAMN